MYLSIFNTYSCNDYFVSIITVNYMLLKSKVWLIDLFELFSCCYIYIVKQLITKVLFTTYWFFPLLFIDHLDTICFDRKKNQYSEIVSRSLSIHSCIISISIQYIYTESVIYIRSIFENAER